MDESLLLYRNMGSEDSWPLLLVGPIVRRVTSTSVAVFVATSRACTVTLTIYNGTRSTKTLLKSSSEKTRAIGKRLHLLVIEVTGLTLSAGVLYGYDVRLDPGTGAKGLLELGYLGGSYKLEYDSTKTTEVPLGYEAGALPGFVLPQGKTNLKFIYESCRKPHGGGPDMLPTADRLIQAVWSDPVKRPQQLLLTGDQVYADDVAGGLLFNLTAIGRKLLEWGTPEKLPDYKGNQTFDDRYSGVDPFKRKEFLAAQYVKQRSDYNLNHLLFFQEWCAMYVMAWSEALWAPNPKYVPGSTGVSRYTLTKARSLNINTAETTGSVLEYAHLLPYSRRALANAATYMIFDDHEVTDDWYLNGRVSRILRENPLGKRIVRNALMGYALFQDWGNQPEQYRGTTGPGSAFMTALTLSGTSPPIASSPDTCDAILDIGAVQCTPERRSTRLRWDYMIEGPDHRILFLDTRTWRSFPDIDAGLVRSSVIDLGKSLATDPVPGSDALEKQLGEGQRKLNAWLISEKAMAFQITDRIAPGGSLVTPSKQLFVVSAAPVFGFFVVEMLQRAKVIQVEATATLTSEGGDEALDNEPWIGNSKAFSTLLKTLSVASPVVFLSGDVHYAFTTDNSYALTATSGTVSRKHFVQLCSSSACNSDTLTKALSASEIVTTPLLAGEWTDLQALKTLIPDKEQMMETFEGLLSSMWERTKEEAALVWEYGFEYDDAWMKAKLQEATTAAWELTSNTFQSAVYAVENPWSILYGDVLIKTPLIADEVDQMLEESGLVGTPWHYTDYVYDRRSAADRFKHSKEAQTWYSGLTSQSQKELYAQLNFCSVGHSNLGVVCYANSTTLRHELIWTYASGISAFSAPWLVTQHDVNMTVTPAKKPTSGGPT